MVQNIIYRYFKTLFHVLAATVILAASTWILGVAIGRNQMWIYALGIFLLTAAVNGPKIVFFFRVMSECRKKAPQRKLIIVKAIEADERFTFYNRSGALAGEEKSLLTNNEGIKYRFTGNSGPCPWLIGRKLQIEYLPKTSFLIQVTPCCKATEKDYIRFFRRYFSDYVSKKIIDQ